MENSSENIEKPILILRYMNINYLFIMAKIESLMFRTAFLEFKVIYDLYEVS